MSYRLKCQNKNCSHEFLRYWPKDEYETLQYNTVNGEYKGIACFDCGFPKMVVMKSKQVADDGFKAGFQRNIMKYCNTYAEYKAHLKNMGLIEIGYEKTEDRKFSEPFFTPDLCRQLNQKHGISLSPLEMEGLNKEINEESA